MGDLHQGVPRTRRQAQLRLVLLVTDAAALTLSMLIATFIRFGTLAEPVAFEDAAVSLSFWQLGLLVVPIWLAFLSAEGLYDTMRLSWGSGEFSRVARSLSLGVVGFIVLTYVLKVAELSRAWTLIAWVVSVLLVVLARTAVRVSLAHMRRAGRMLRPTLIVGSNAEGAAIIRILRASRADGLVPVGCLASSQAERLSLDFCGPDVPCLGDARDIRTVIRDQVVDTVIIASSAFDHDVLARMISEVRDLDVDLHISSGLFEVLTTRVLVREVGGVPLISVRGVSLTRLNLLTKRAFDIAVSLSVILLLLPIWVLIAVLVRSYDSGSVFFAQRRIGRDGVPFNMLKFRSMVVDAEERLVELQQANEASGPLFKMREDPRITPIGRWMRRYSIDEFPQLINVLRGEMSLVGPRPPLPDETKGYTEYDWRRMSVVPGMTGLWQVSGRSNLTFDEMVRLDLFYIENWSVSLDMALLLRTVPAVLLPKGAY